MSLPNDVARCIGHRKAGEPIAPCAKCARYVPPGSFAQEGQRVVFMGRPERPVDDCEFRIAPREATASR
jgi:hypothetical protein